MAIVKGIAGASGGGTDTSDATGKQWDIKNGLTAYIASGKVTGTGYFPAAMDLGTAGYYSKNYTSSGNKVAGIIRFKAAAAANSSFRRIIANIGPTGYARSNVEIGDSNNSDADFQNKIRIAVQSSAGSNICRLYTSGSYADDEWHTVRFEFDGDAGTAVLEVDNASDINTGATNHNAATTGTLDSGASSIFSVGATAVGAEDLEGEISFCGLRDTAGLTGSDFVQSDGSPKPLDESTWTEWGGTQPAFWHPSGKMDENLGSAGAMTANGTITLAAASSWS